MGMWYWGGRGTKCGLLMKPCETKTAPAPSIHLVQREAGGILPASVTILVVSPACQTETSLAAGSHLQRQPGGC